MTSIVDDECDFVDLIPEIKDQIRATEAAIFNEAMGMLKELVTRPDLLTEYSAEDLEALHELIRDPCEIVDQVRQHIRTMFPAEEIVKMQKKMLALRLLRGTSNFRESFPATSAIYADKVAQ